jgi:4-hydroxybenzoate polyprenyltransferase
MSEAIKGYLICMGSRKVVLAYNWPAILCMFLTSWGLPPLLDALKIVIAVTFVGYAVYFYNDLMDVADDLKNKELGNPIPASRPFASRRVTKGMMILYILLSGTIGLITAATINYKVLNLLIFYIILGVLYSTEPIKLKKRVSMKQIIIGSGYTLVHLAGSYAIGSPNPAVLYLTTLDFIMAVGVNPILDLRDMEGDRAIGVKTIPIIFGPKFTVRLAIAVLAASGVATLIGYSRIGFNIAMPSLFLIVVLAFIYVLYPLIREWSNPVYLNKVALRRALPLLLLLQLTFLIGILPLPF